MPTILVVDDDTGIRTIFERTLTQAGYDVLLAANGKEGIHLHRLHPADVAIIDVFMPDQDGLETITMLRRLSPEAGIIAVSGGYTASSTMLSIALELGARRILEKPFDADTLLQAIEEVLLAHPVHHAQRQAA